MEDEEVRVNSRAITRKNRLGVDSRLNAEVPVYTIDKDLITEMKSREAAKVALSSFHINRILKNLRPFMGCYSMDEVSKLTPPHSCIRWGIIINLSKKNEPGTHWVTLIIDPQYEFSVMYYDSFGDPPPEFLMKEIKRLVSKLHNKYKLKMKINSVCNQDEETFRCGFHAMMFLIKVLLLGQTFPEATKYAATEDDAARYQRTIFDYISQEDDKQSLERETSTVGNNEALVQKGMTEMHM